MKKGKVFWLGRDGTDNGAYEADECSYGANGVKMKTDKDNCVKASHRFCPQIFEATTHIKLKPGKQSRFRLVEIKKLGLKGFWVSRDSDSYGIRGHVFFSPKKFVRLAGIKLEADDKAKFKLVKVK